MSSEAIEYGYLHKDNNAMEKNRDRNHEVSKEPDSERNHGRLVVLRPETPNSVLAQRNVIHTEDERRKLGAAVEATVRAERAVQDPEGRVAELEALDAKTPLYDFEK